MQQREYGYGLLATSICRRQKEWHYSYRLPGIYMRSFKMEACGCGQTYFQEQDRRNTCVALASSQLGRLHIILARRRRGRWWYGGHLFIGYIIYIEREIYQISRLRTRVFGKRRGFVWTACERYMHTQKHIYVRVRVTLLYQNINSLRSQNHAPMKCKQLRDLAGLVAGRWGGWSL